VPISETKRKANKQYYQEHRNDILRSARKMSTEEMLVSECRWVEMKAWDALAKKNFGEFGYFAELWKRLNQISGEHLPNPWSKFVQIAKNLKEGR